MELNLSLDHPAYLAARKLRGYRYPVIPTGACTNSDAGKILILNNPAWSKADHLELAVLHRKAADHSAACWTKIADAASMAAFGRPYEITDYKISAIARDEFSEEHKRLLRHHALAGSNHRLLACAHEAAAKNVNRYKR